MVFFGVGARNIGGARAHPGPPLATPLPPDTTLMPDELNEDLVVVVCSTWRQLLVREGQLFAMRKGRYGEGREEPFSFILIGMLVPIKHTCQFL